MAISIATTASKEGAATGQASLAIGPLTGGLTSYLIGFFGNRENATPYRYPNAGCYAGSPLTLLGAASQAEAGTWVGYMNNAPVGPCNLVVSFTGADYQAYSMIGIEYFGVAAISTGCLNSGANASPLTDAIPGSPGRTIVGFVSTDGGIPVLTEFGTCRVRSGSGTVVSDYELPLLTGSAVIDWGLAGAFDWATVGFSLTPTAAGRSAVWFMFKKWVGWARNIPLHWMARRQWKRFEEDHLNLMPI